MYKCNECGRELYDLPALKRHLNDSHPFTYTCQYCGTKEKGKHNLKHHLYNRHGVEMQI